MMKALEWRMPAPAHASMRTAGLVPVVWILAAGAVPASAQTVPSGPPPVAPSQVTPRSLAPAAPSAPIQLELPRGAPVDVPQGADDLPIRVERVAVDGGFDALSARADAIFGSVTGRAVSVGDLYRAAGELEKAYSDAGFFLARVVVPQQRLVDGGEFRVTVIDGFIETVDASALPWQARRPVERVMQRVVGRRKLGVDEMERRLNLAGGMPGVTMRSTLARGSVPEAARLILDGRFQPFGFNIGGDNGLGPSFNNWGLNLQAQINSVAGDGEQIYLFLSGEPRIDRAFRQDARRRVGGIGAQVPLSADGLMLNPEFTVSDTAPVARNPILASDGRLYRGALNLSAPLLATRDGTLSGRLGLEAVSETQTLTFFALPFYKDRLTVVRGALTWQGGLGDGTFMALTGTVSQGLALLGAATRDSLANAPQGTSRGSDPQFTKAETRMVISHALPDQVALTITARAQLSFGTVLPNSEAFDLTGLDALSSFTAGGLTADGGVSLRTEVGRAWTVTHGLARLSIAPYLYAAGGKSHLVLPDPLTPTRAASYGVGVRLNGAGFPLRAQPSLTLEYGRGHQNRGAPSNDRLSIALGVQF